VVEHLRQVDPRSSNQYTDPPKLKWADNVQNHDRDPVEYFEQFFLGDECIETILKCTSERLRKDGRRPLEKKELMVFIAPVMRAFDIQELVSELVVQR